MGFVHSHKLGEQAGALVFVVTTWHLAPTAQKVGNTRALPSDRESKTHRFCLMPIQHTPAPIPQTRPSSATRALTFQMLRRHQAQRYHEGDFLREGNGEGLMRLFYFGFP